MGQSLWSQLGLIDDGNLVKLAGELGLDVQQQQEQLSDSKIRDVIGRIRIGDIDGTAELTGIERKKASQLIRKYNETVGSGIEERKVLRTPDARKLERDILSLIAEGASSELARNKLLLLTPTLDAEIIKDRLNSCLQGKQIFDELTRAGGPNDLQRILAGLSLEATPPKKSQQNEQSDTVRYFVARKSPIEATLAILTGFQKAQALISLFKDVDLKALEEVLRLLQEVESSETREAESIISDAEMLINQKLRRGGLDEERARRVVEDGIEGVVGSLKMSSEEENGLRRAAFESLSIPFEFDRTNLKKVVQGWNQRQEREREAKAAKTDALLKRHLDLVEKVVERAILLDQILTVASAMKRYSLVAPTIGSGGLSFVGGRNLFLVKEHFEGRIGAVQPVNYSIGRTRSVRSSVARPRYVIMLTGANSGGKTTLLTTVATIHILTLLGLPVPCEEVEVAPLPIHLFRRRVTRKVGSLEQAMSSLIPVFADRRRKLVLMDEFEALTEPGAAGRILATMMNEAATSSSLVLLVTHLARETLPYVKLPIRVDGIEAQGLDKEGELIVDRQPKFNHIGSSTPKLIAMKLSRMAKKKNLKALYKNILSSLESETVLVQTPLSLPWISEGDEADSK